MVDPDYEGGGGGGYTLPGESWDCQGEPLIVPYRDLVSTRQECLLDRKIPENFLFGQAKLSMKNFQYWIFWTKKRILSLLQTIFMTEV